MYPFSSVVRRSAKGNGWSGRVLVFGQKKIGSYRKYRRRLLQDFGSTIDAADTIARMKAGMRVEKGRRRKGEEGARGFLSHCEKESDGSRLCSSRTEIGVSAIAPSHKRVVRDKRERVYNSIDEAIILRANEHYCQRDVDKNGRANHEIPRGGPARLESGKNRVPGRSIDWRYRSIVRH